MQDKIPVLMPNVELGSRAQLQTQPDELTTRLYNAVAPSVVKIENHSGGGSGFFLDGEVVTDAHVIEHAGPVKVVLKTGQSLPATVTKIDYAHDLALLHVEQAPNTVNSLTSGNSLKQNQSAIWALGHPLGLPDIFISPGTIETTASLSHISNMNRDAFRDLLSGPTGQDAHRRLLVSNSHVEHGNSGGPGTDPDGKVIGVADLGFGGKSAFTPVEDIYPMFHSKKYDVSVKYTTGRSELGELYHEHPTAILAEIAWQGTWLSAYYKLASTTRIDIQQALSSPNVLAPISSGAGLRRLGVTRLAPVFTGGMFAAMLKVDYQKLRAAEDLPQTLLDTLNLGVDTVGLMGSAAALFSRSAKLGRIGIMAGFAGAIASRLFIEPSVRDATELTSDLTVDKPGTALHAATDIIGSVGALGMALGRLNPRLSLFAMGVSVLADSVVELLPVHTKSSYEFRNKESNKGEGLPRANGD